MLRSHTFECALHIDWERYEIMGEGRRRLLVIEDDAETAEQLVDFLSTSGYQVDLATDGNEGLSRGRSAEYAVMTIDRMLPDIDGLAVIRRFRDDGIVTPALIISALGEIDDRVRGRAPAATITSSSRLPSRSYWRGSRRSPGAARPSSRKRCSASATSSSTSYRERRPAAAGKSSCCRANFKFSSTSFAMTAASFRERCCCNMYGICTSTPRPTSSTCMSGASAERSTVSRLTRSFIPSAASGFVSV